MVRKLRCVIVITLAVLAVGSSVNAHNITGNAFLTLKTPEAAYYVAGFSDAYEYYLMGSGKQMPEGVTLGQMVDIITKYVASHPESRHWNMASLAFWALTEAFPKSSLENFGDKK